MLRFERVGLRYADGPVLAGFDLAVAPGELVVLLGPSGCGKTTLLRLAARLAAPSTGRVVNRFARTAVVFQEPRLLPWWSALDNVAFALAARGVAPAERRGRAAALLGRLGFSTADLRKRPAALSGGMQGRTAIARALVVEPDLVLMDEPFAALDVGLRRDLQDLVRGAVDRDGAAVLFVTHDVTEAVRMADRLVVLSRRPARVVHDVRTRPEASPAAIHRAAAALLDTPAVRAALLARHGEPGQPERPQIRPGRQPAPAAPSWPAR
ncbi:ATP-binding cassette domain-containing protein [Rhodoplanes serenus]|uniref:ATP-binding cassette domain-containing protein n=1 Tax=Rhodoplanes serenus TaxID=200615 RepID=A0A9X5AQY5_9BRAD|nr:ATP-binding cassette domain-containing protein [Rhodoplanes serenus]MTW14764.1 ATP-binding cassette domain-containing protein [Rhodoplanes serenus]